MSILNFYNMLQQKNPKLSEKSRSMDNLNIQEVILNERLGFTPNAEGNLRMNVNRMQIASRNTDLIPKGKEPADKSPVNHEKPAAKPKF